MSLEEAAEKACQESKSVLLAKRMGHLSPKEVETLYKMGFADGALHGLSQWNAGADQVKRDQEKPEWLRNVLTGGRDIPNGQ